MCDSPALWRDVVWAVIAFAMFMLGMTTTIVYVLRQRRRMATPAKHETPTLTGVTVDELMRGLAAKCRRRGDG